MPFEGVVICILNPRCPIHLFFEHKKTIENRYKKHAVRQ
jgi:hypothetical protein